MNAPCVSILVLATLLCLNIQSAAQCIDYSEYFRLEGRYVPSGTAEFTAASDGYLFLSTDGAPNLQVVDATDPSNPTLVHTVLTGSPVSGLVSVNDWIYALAGGQLEIVDAAVPSAAATVGRWDVPDLPLGVAVDGTRAFVTTTRYSTETGRHYDLWVVDISDPSDPGLLGSMEVGATAYSPVYAAGHVYVAGRSTDVVTIIDVSDSAAPAVVGTTAVPGDVQYLCTANGYLYAAEFLDERLHTLDIAAPASPVLVNTLDMEGRGKSLCYDDGFLFVTRGLQWESDVALFDVSVADAPAVATHFHSGAWSNHVSADAGWLYVADDDGVRIAGPVSSFVPVLGQGGGYDLFNRAVETRDDIAYVANQSGSTGLMLWYVAYPEAPVLMSTTPRNQLYELVLDGNHAYAAGFGLFVYDVSNPFEIPEPAAAYVPDSCSDIALSGDHAYLAANRYNLQYFDISNPMAPAHLDSLALPGRPEALDVAGDYVYVACGFAGLVVVDISIPDSPVVVGAVASLDYASEVRVEGSVAFVSDSWKGPVIFDLSDPTQPQYISSVEVSGTNLRLDYSAGYLYVAASFNGLQIVDVTDLAQPSVVGFLSTAGPVLNVDAGEDNVYLATGTDGLAIGSLQCSDYSAVPDDDGPSTSSGMHRGAVALDVSPNPFNPQTVIRFRLERSERVRVEVFDLAGRSVAVLADAFYDAGDHTLHWNGRDSGGGTVSSGTYLVRCESPSDVDVQKMMMLR